MWPRKKPKNFKIETPFNRNIAYVECKNMCDDSNNRGIWNHPKICQELSERHVWNARYQGTTKEHTHTKNCVHTLESTNLQTQKHLLYEITLHVNFTVNQEQLYH